MQKFVLVPDAHYNNLVQKEKSNTGYKQAVTATVKNLENQELLQRQHYYDEANEEFPKNHNKVLKQTAVTKLPPPSLIQDRKMNLLKEMQAAQLKPKTVIPKPRKTTVRKPVIAKQTVCKVQTPKPVKNEPNILDQLKFVKPKKHY